MNFMQKFCMGFYMGTSPAWILYTLHGQQWNIGESTKTVAFRTLKRFAEVNPITVSQENN